MSNNYFAFKQFTVYHDQCAMKVGTDGVLLGAWVSAEAAGTILDIGTGTGLIALMCAQKCNARIDAVEIDPDACRQAVQNFNASRWNQRIILYPASFQTFALQNRGPYDLIVSNPPYYRNALKAPDRQRTTARHNEQLTWESLLFHTRKLLTSTGSFCVIIPAPDAEHFIRLAYFNGLHPREKTFIRSVSYKPPVRCLLRFTASEDDHCEINELSIRNNENEYSSAFRDLTRDYYLNF